MSSMLFHCGAKVLLCPTHVLSHSQNLVRFQSDQQHDEQQCAKVLCQHCACQQTKAQKDVRKENIDV